MSRRLPLIALWLAACAPPHYEPPSLSEPHALVTVRIVHHEVSGPDAVHHTLIDGHAIGLGARTTIVAGAPMSATVRVRPQPAVWRFQSAFSHTEQRMETVYEDERYACGTEQVGYGTSRRTQTRYCSRRVPRQRWRQVRVPDGSCEAAFPLSPRIDLRYVVQFDYHGPSSCRARCFVRQPLPGGQFHLLPCSAGLPASPPPRPQPSPAAPPPSSAGEALDTPGEI